MTSHSPTRPANKLLSRLDPSELELLKPHLEFTRIFFREPLYESNKTIDRVYFPDSGLMSIVTILEDKAQVEALSVGVEGMVGLPILLGATTAPSSAYCQVPGTVWSMAASDLAAAIEKSSHIRHHMHRYANAAIGILAQTTACNRLHSTEQRCARWLLLTRDRLGNNTFPLTHEFLAAMLGVRRPGLSLVAKALQTANLISYKHGMMTILDEAGLAEISCVCYKIARQQIEQLD